MHVSAGESVSFSDFDEHEESRIKMTCIEDFNEFAIQQLSPIDAVPTKRRTHTKKRHEE
jgi:hypothetical protein